MRTGEEVLCQSRAAFGDCFQPVNGKQNGSVGQLSKAYPQTYLHHDLKINIRSPRSMAQYKRSLRNQNFSTIRGWPARITGLGWVLGKGFVRLQFDNRLNCESAKNESTVHVQLLRPKRGGVSQTFVN